jgi:hypothetical protein
MHREKQYDEDLKNLRTTLDIGSHINASLQLLPEAGTQWRLEAVSCKALFGWEKRAALG